MCITDKEVKAFKRDGVVCLRGILTDEMVEGMRGAIDDQMRHCGLSGTGYNLEAIASQIWAQGNRVDVGAAKRLDMDNVARRIQADSASAPLLEPGQSGEQAAFFYDVAGWKTYKSIRETALDSALPEAAATLLESKLINFWEDTTFVKTPGTRQKTAFHQDYAYFQITGEQCVVVWIPLDPASAENGVMRYIRGSHLWGRTFAPNLVISQTPTTEATDEKLMDIESNEDAYDIISFDVEPGDVIIHHVMTIHGAGGNMSDRNRRAVSFRYCGDDVRYFDRKGAVPQASVTHALQDGEPLRALDYPIVWPKPWPGMKLADLWPATSQR